MRRYYILAAIFLFQLIGTMARATCDEIDLKAEFANSCNLKDASCKTEICATQYRNFFSVLTTSDAAKEKVCEANMFESFTRAQNAVQALETFLAEHRNKENPDDIFRQLDSCFKGYAVKAHKYAEVENGQVSPISTFAKEISKTKAWCSSDHSLGELGFTFGNIARLQKSEKVTPGDFFLPIEHLKDALVIKDASNPKFRQLLIESFGELSGEQNKSEVERLTKDALESVAALSEPSPVLPCTPLESAARIGSSQSISGRLAYIPVEKLSSVKDKLSLQGSCLNIPDNDSEVPGILAKFQSNLRLSSKYQQCATTELRADTRKVINSENSTSK